MRAVLGWPLFLLSSLLLRLKAVKVSQPTEIVKVLDDPDSYNRHATPNQEQDESTLVTIYIYIEGLSSIRAQTMDFNVDIYFTQVWIDKRLEHNSPHRVLVKDLGIFDKMWHPDLYFANANSAKFFDVTTPNFLLWIFPNGTVYHEMRISLTVICNLDLGKYPLDSQTCNMRLLSCKPFLADAYTTEQLTVKWQQPQPIAINDELRLPDMMIVNITPHYCNGTYTHGTWSCLTLQISLQREIMHHILQSYVPTMLIVVISWFSFWLDIDAVPGRVSLCITTLLTLATQASSARMALPQVSYAKAIDVWMEACLGFVFGVLIEFTGVNYLSRRGLELEETMEELRAKLSARKGAALPLPPDDEKRMRERRRMQLVEESLELLVSNEGRGAGMSWDGVGLLNNALDQRTAERNRRWRVTAIHIDKLCRAIFPLAFIFFNCIYWPYYLWVT